MQIYGQQVFICVQFYSNVIHTLFTCQPPQDIVNIYISLQLYYSVL